MEQSNSVTPAPEPGNPEAGREVARPPVEVTAEPIEGSQRRQAPPGKRAWLRWVPGVQTVMALGYYLMDDDAPTMQRFIVLISFIYLLSPFDILPEALLGPLGLVDDAAVFLSLVRFIGSAALKPYRQRAREWMMRSDA